MGLPVLFGNIIGGRAGQLIPVCSCFIVDNLSLAFGYMKIEEGILPILGILLRGGGGTVGGGDLLEGLYSAAAAGGGDTKFSFQKRNMAKSLKLYYVKSK